MAPIFFSKLKPQSIKTEIINGYQVFRVSEDLALGADFGVLTKFIEKAVRKGQTKIAINFTPQSYLYTPTVARLVDYFKLLQQHKGTLCLVQPNEDILQVLDMIGLTKFVRIVHSEKDL
jgi:anti-anti-sigma factor